MSDLLEMTRDTPLDGVVRIAADHYMGHRADPKRFKDIVNPVQHWVKKEQPTPGALAYAYETLALPEFGIVDSGIGSSYFFKLFQTPSYQYNKSVPITGLGGIVAGTIVSSPLYNPANNTFGGAEFNS